MASRIVVVKKVLLVLAVILAGVLAFRAVTLPMIVPALIGIKKETIPIFTTEATPLTSTVFPHSYSIMPKARTNKTLDIAMIIVYTEGTPLENYATALNSMECYAKLHSYHFHLISDSKYQACAKHKDLFFRRHCCIALFMYNELRHASWLMVLDGDIAVVNPNILIEQFINPNYEITLFDRFFNFEVGANSYLVKNSKIGRQFVQGFAEYEFLLPKSFHGTDNGALHPYLAGLLAPENGRLVDSICDKIWKSSKSYKTLFEMEACTRLIFGDRTHFAEQKLRILSKGKAWVRDLWLLKSHWADDDFMLHAVKEKQLAKLRPDFRNVTDSQLYQWDPMESRMRTFPLLQKLDIAKCQLGEEQWHFDSRLKISTEKKRRLLETMETKILKKRLETIGRLAQRILIT